MFNAKSLPFLKSKSSDITNKIKQFKLLETDAEKSKFYLLSLIQRLEMIEFTVDKFIDTKYKENMAKAQDSKE